MTITCLSFLIPLFRISNTMLSASVNIGHLCLILVLGTKYSLFFTMPFIRVKMFFPKANIKKGNKSKCYISFQYQNIFYCTTHFNDHLIRKLCGHKIKVMSCLFEMLNFTYGKSFLWEKLSIMPYFPRLDFTYFIQGLEILPVIHSIRPSIHQKIPTVSWVL